MYNPLKELHQAIRELFRPVSGTISTGILSVQYNDSMRQDLCKCLGLLRSKRVLFSKIDHEIWEYAFASLRKIRDDLAFLDGTMQYKGPNDIKHCIQTMSYAIAYYLELYEYDYKMFMEGPLLRNLAPVHKERNWPSLGNAATDLIKLRSILNQAITNLNSFADKGEILDWSFSNSYVTEQFIKYANNRKLCPLCGWDLEHFKSFTCPTNQSNCPNFSKYETVFHLRQDNLHEVYVTGSFSNWEQIALNKYNWNDWAARVPITKGKYYYKFIIDGQWILDPENQLVEKDNNGNENSVLVVK